ncbi:uncharacterized protein [Venturia canescens]|uniref:uncharacterized protein n=1 Tax=Venturia canescens TaxID=32260 RepID=UPI001C9C90E9|nr:uncharacterized protein LOC122411700 [Venturia canescens]
MEFRDASEGMSFQKSMTIRNIGKVPAYVKICQPNSMAVKIKTLKRSVMLSPGLALVRTVTYSFKRPALLRATIPIEINHHPIDYRIICSLSTEYISINPGAVDFRIVDIGCSSSTEIITISNVGGKSTRFTIDLGKNDLEVTVKPHRGIVRPRSSVKLHVEMIGLAEGTFYSEFWTSTRRAIRLTASSR